MLFLGLLGRGGRPLQVKVSVLWLFVLNHQISLPPSPCCRKGGLGMLQVTCGFTSGNLPENPPVRGMESAAGRRPVPSYWKCRHWQLGASQTCGLFSDTMGGAAWAEVRCVQRDRF